jgi:hypothetical protein
MSDYSALAQRVSLSISGIRGCLMLSRDGMLLGAHPEGEAESSLRAAWVRFAGVGDPERSYVEFADQIWAYVRRGAYGAFAVADMGVRPGVLVDLLEQALMAGEQDRAHDREAMRLPDAPTAPSGKPRTSLHRSERPGAVEPEPVVVASEGTNLPPPAELEASAGTPQGTTTDPPGTADAEPAAAATDDPGSAAPDPSAAGTARETQEGKEDESEVDRILLAKEFAGLLQVPKEDDEASR